MALGGKHVTFQHRLCIPAMFSLLLSILAVAHDDNNEGFQRTLAMTSMCQTHVPPSKEQG